MMVLLVVRIRHENCAQMARFFTNFKPDFAPKFSLGVVTDVVEGRSQATQHHVADNPDTPRRQLIDPHRCRAYGPCQQSDRE